MEHARSLGERALGWSAEVTYGLQLYLLRREQDRLAEVEELVRRAVEEHPTYPIWRCVLAQMLAELERTDEAQQTLDGLAADGFAQVPFDESRLVSLGLLAEVASSLGDREHAAALYELLLPYGDRLAVAYPEISTGAVARNLGLAAWTVERFEDAERHFEAALELNERVGARPWLARTEADRARMRRERS